MKIGQNYAVNGNKRVWPENAPKTSWTGYQKPPFQFLL